MGERKGGKEETMFMNQCSCGGWELRHSCMWGNRRLERAAIANACDMHTAEKYIELSLELCYTDLMDTLLCAVEICASVV